VDLEMPTEGDGFLLKTFLFSLFTRSPKKTNYKSFPHRNGVTFQQNQQIFPQFSLEINGIMRKNGGLQKVY